MVLSVKNGRMTLRRSGGRVVERLPDGDPLDAVRTLLREFQPATVPGLPTFQGGAVAYLGYDMVRGPERRPAPAHDDLGLADAVFMFTDTLLVFDHRRHRLLVIASARIDGRDDASLDQAYDRAALLIGTTLARLGRSARPPAPLGLTAPGPLVALGEEGFTSTMHEAAYTDAVRRVKAHLAAGDASQVVLSRRLDCPLTADPFTVYRALRTVDPSPYLFFLRLGRATIAGSSPEVLARLEGNRVDVRPVSGAGPRGDTEAQDRELEEAKRADPRERAEHERLVDLGRTDVGRVTIPGSVEVIEFMGIERSSNVMRLASRVTGTLKPGADALAVLQARFPAGTLTGAPKIRAMEIIDELEVTGRGPYGGAIGNISYSGNLDSCVSLRTIVCHGNRASVQVGARIVADSDPKAEWLDTCARARGPLLALRMASTTASP